MQERRYNDSKLEIRSVLLTYSSSVTLEEFLKSYKNLLGERLPSKSLGFYSDVQFLQSMPDVVNVCIDRNGKVSLTGIADESSEHIQKLVSKQRKPQTKNSKSKKNFSNQGRTYKFPTVKEQPFLSAALRAEILQIMDRYHNGVTFSAFVLAYRKKFNKFLPLIRGLDSLEGMISLIPEFEVRTVNNERLIFYTNNHINNNHLKIAETGKNISSSQAAGGKEYKNGNNTNNTCKSGITEDILQNFQLVLDNHPEGILDVHFPPLYENVTKRNFDILDLGYNSIIELVDALPDIFKRVLNPDGNRNWIILPAKKANKSISKGENSGLASSQMYTPSKVREGIPADVASPSLQYIRPTLLETDNVYVPVFVSAIVNPGLFWFQLQTEDMIKNFEKFENDMGYFYDNYANFKYAMNDADIVIGATCVICYPEDKQWYRAMIKSIPSKKFINVLFIDYGSRENIPRSNIYYVRSKYHDYPAHAFKAQLAGLKLPNNALAWNVKAQQRFIQLCECSSLMARLQPIDEDTFSVYLCDTSKGYDIHINDTLIEEGFAEFCIENEFQVKNCISNNCKVPVCSHITSDSDCYFSSESAEMSQSLSEADQTNSEFESDALHVKRKLVFSPKEQINGNDSNISHTAKRQYSKRYVKQVKLCEDYKIHIINLEDQLYVTCGDLCKLLWCEKDSSFLIERLKYKEVEVPSLTLLKEDFVSLFEQCIWYKIPEYEKLESSNSSLMLYTLDWAFSILNIFGHPSVCLRLAIQNEMRRFDPLDPIWKEFNIEEVDDLSDIEKEIAEQLSKLCLYDLKAKNEALKVKRMNFMRINNSSTSEEIKRIDNLQRVISRRMKQIENICSQYSSCS